MLILVYAAGIAACVVFALMIIKRWQALGLLHHSSFKKLIWLVLWMIPLSDNTADANTRLHIRESNKLLYLLLSLYAIFFIALQF